MQEEIVTDLGRINGLTTLSARTIAQAREKTTDVRELRRVTGASHVLRGRVQANKDQVTVTAELVDTITGRAIWSKNFSSEVSRFC